MLKFVVLSEALNAFAESIRLNDYYILSLQAQIATLRQEVVIVVHTPFR